jgi:hypothetical protein
VAAEYATVSTWYHDAVTGTDRFITQGATRDTVTDAWITANYAAVFAGSPLTGLPAKLAAFLAAHPRGWEFS